MKTRMFWSRRQIDVNVYGFITIPDGFHTGPQNVYAVAYNVGQDGKTHMELVPADELEPID